ncbi:MAG TPA: CPBP family intramembrane glutamic endopeptidase [Verrucomicrobiae bacterium]|nr:CPBP family intramembrane glutamic endopeptidase [Verrucomicrobiae bacterium]
MNDRETNPESHLTPHEPPDLAPSFSAANQPSYVHTLFWGPSGLRPGWGFALYVALFFPLQTLATQLAWSHDFGASGLWSVLLEEFGWLVAALLPALLLWRIERRPWGIYGLPPAKALGKFPWLGALWGFAAISLLMLLLRGFGAFDFGPLALHGARILRFASYWGLMFLLVGLFEEFLVRGYTQFTLARGIGFWPAAVALSCLFGLIHMGNGGEKWPGLLAAGWIGLFFCLTLRRTGSLWFAVGFHAAWDWGESYIYSVPDSGTLATGHLLRTSLHGKPWLSGGTVGPEGSVLCFLVIGLAWLAFDRVYPRSRVAG